MDPGESAAEACAREVLEETGSCLGKQVDWFVLDPRLAR